MDKISFIIPKNNTVKTVSKIELNNKTINNDKIEFINNEKIEFTDDQIEFINNGIIDFINNKIEFSNKDTIDFTEKIIKNKDLIEKSGIMENQISKSKPTKINSYTKIVDNVYKFDTVTNNNESELYILYGKAIEFKKSNNYLDAIRLFKECKNIIINKNENERNNLKEINYEILINLALLISDMDIDVNEVYLLYNEASKIYPDRAEPYYYCSIYLNKKQDFNRSYELLNKALLLNYEDSKKKYPRTQESAYGKYLYDELSVSCYWLKKYDESKFYLEKIIDDVDFSIHRSRLQQNLKFTNEELSKNN